jgi:chemotaxis protein MotB
MSRRKRQRPHTSHERWLVSYADFITLLFAFFVVLFASARVDQQKVGRLATAIQVAFQQLGAFPAPAMQAPAHPISTPTIPSEPLDSLPEDPNLAGLQTELKDALQSEIEEHKIDLHREADGLVVSLREFGFFDSGSPALKPSALPTLDRIASILAARTCRLRIEGHTDNVPIHTRHMASNWELSTARSTELVRLLMLRYSFPPQRLSAAGFAEYHPIASNHTAQGRAQNRRVDIVILNGSPQGKESQPPANPSLLP